MEHGTRDFIFGIHPVLEALRSEKVFDKILIQEGLRNPDVARIKEFTKERAISRLTVHKQRLNKITTRNHQGVIGFLSPIEFVKIERLLPPLLDRGIAPFVLVLDKISDVRNFGAIVRTAECAGVDAVIIPKKGAAQINADAVKTSAGALYNIPVCKSGNIRSTGEFLKANGLKLVAATARGAEEYTRIDYTGPLALVMGSEDKGVSFDLLGIADNKAHIPVTGSVGSLNVSVAAGILLFEALRQRA